MLWQIKDIIKESVVVQKKQENHTFFKHVKIRKKDKEYINKMLNTMKDFLKQHIDEEVKKKIEMNYMNI